MTARRALFALLVAWGCAPHPTAGRRPWEARVGAGPLAVRGARRADPGPTIFRALSTDPDTRTIVAANGEPDTLRVVCRREGGTRVILTYARGAGGKPRQVVAEPAGGVRGVCAPSRPGQSRIATRRSAAGGAVARGDQATRPLPTARQSLECPIDPARADCRTLCAASSTYEWCR